MSFNSYCSTINPNNANEGSAEKYNVINGETTECHFSPIPTTFNETCPVPDSGLPSISNQLSYDEFSLDLVPGLVNVSPIHDLQGGVKLVRISSNNLEQLLFCKVGPDWLPKPGPVPPGLGKSFIKGALKSFLDSQYFLKSY